MEGAPVTTTELAIRTEVLHQRDAARLVVAANTHGSTRVQRRADLRELLDMLGLLPHQDEAAIDHAMTYAARALPLANHPQFARRRAHP
jgi:hypothetical protein